MTKPWAMARVASRRQLPKPRKMMGPVGRQIDAAHNCMNDEEINRPTDKRIWFATGECSCCRECGYHVCSCEEDDNPGMMWTLAEREKMVRVGGVAGYLEVCRDRMAAISGLNSVARGEEPTRRVCALCDATVGPGWNFCEKHRGINPLPEIDWSKCE